MNEESDTPALSDDGTPTVREISPTAPEAIEAPITEPQPTEPTPEPARAPRVRQISPNIPEIREALGTEPQLPPGRIIRRQAKRIPFLTGNPAFDPEPEEVITARQTIDSAKERVRALAAHIMGEAKETTTLVESAGLDDKALRAMGYDVKAVQKFLTALTDEIEKLTPKT